MKSSKVDIKLKREPKQVILSEGETASVLSIHHREGKIDRQKLLVIFLPEDQEDLLVEE